MGKKGASGIGVLFILIAILLIAVVFSLIYVKYSYSMKNKAGSLFNGAKTEASSAVKIIEFAGTDGRDGYLSNFTLMARILPGSAEITLSECSLIFSSDSGRVTLKYKENGKIGLGNDGYNTWTHEEFGSIPIMAWTVLEEDLDDDGVDDYFMVNDSHVLFNISGTDGNFSVVALNSANHSLDITQGNKTLSNYAMISEEADVFGYLNITGFNPNTTLIDKSVHFDVIPEQKDKGYYSVEYISRTAVPVQGVFMEGDTIQIYFQSYKKFRHDDFVSVNFVCPQIIPIKKTVYLGDTLPRQRKVILYPKI